jgi:hypothetical protein
VAKVVVVVVFPDEVTVARFHRGPMLTGSQSRRRRIPRRGDGRAIPPWPDADWEPKSSSSYSQTRRRSRDSANSVAAAAVAAAAMAAAMAAAEAPGSMAAAAVVAAAVAAAEAPSSMAAASKAAEAPNSDLAFFCNPNVGG